MGNFTISDTVFRQILEYLASKTKGIHKIQKVRVSNYGDGASLYMEVTVLYGVNVIKEINEFKEKSKKEIENLTSMNIVDMEVVVKNIYVPENENK